MVVRIYIGRLSRDARERDVENFFKGYGRIVEVSLKDGYGFVNFEDDRDADDAVYDLNGKVLCGERVVIERARSPSSKREMRGSGGGGRFSGRRGSGNYPVSRSFGRDRGRYSEFRPRNPPPVRTENRVHIENLSSKVSWQDLKDLMKRVGDVTFADAHKIRPGDGVVEFASCSDVKRAIEKYDGYMFEGRKIKVMDAKRKSRSQSRSKSRERSRSNSGSSDGGLKEGLDRNTRHSYNRDQDDEDREKSGGRKRDRDSASQSPQKKYAKSRSQSPVDSNN